MCMVQCIASSAKVLVFVYSSAGQLVYICVQCIGNVHFVWQPGELVATFCYCIYVLSTAQGLVYSIILYGLECRCVCGCARVAHGRCQLLLSLC